MELVGVGWRAEEVGAGGSLEGVGGEVRVKRIGEDGGWKG